MEKPVSEIDLDVATKPASFDRQSDGNCCNASRTASTSESPDIREIEKQYQVQLPSETSWHAISQIVVAFFIAFNTWGLINTFGVFQTFYVRTGILNRSNSEISWIGSLQASLILFTLVIFGPIFDRGYARWLTICGLFLDVFGMMMTSIAHEYWQLMLCQGLCVGLGHGCLFIVAIGQTALTFKRRRWMALGLGQSGGSIGAIIYSEIFRKLQPTRGFGWTTRIIAFIMLGTLLLSSLLLRPHKLPKPRKMFDVNAFRNPSFNAFAVASFAGFMGLYIPFFYIQQYSLAHGLGNLAYSTVAILNAGSVIGRIVPGFVADELGLLNTYSACTIGATALGFIWIACRSLSGIVVFALFYGFFSGCAAALQPAVLASLAPTPNLVGTWVGMGSLFSSSGLLIGTPLGGLIIDNGPWVGLQLWCSCTVLACTAATIFTRMVRSDSKLIAKV